MNLPRNKLDMFSRVADQTGFSRKLVEFVIKDFENSLRFFLANPAVAGREITVKYFGTFFFDIKRARRKVEYGRRQPKKSGREIYLENYLNKFDNEETSVTDKDE